MCEILEGKPNPTVKWYKEGKEIEESASDEITITYESSSGVATLIIHRITISDSAKYTCVARNALGSCSTSAFINVQGIYIEKMLIRLAINMKHGVVLF